MSLNWSKGLTKETDERVRRNSEAQLIGVKTGEESPNWKGDEAGIYAGRARTQKIYPLIEKCEFCDKPATRRHHKDQDTLNNSPRNVQFLCESHHRWIHNLVRYFLKVLPEEEFCYKI